MNRICLLLFLSMVATGLYGQTTEGSNTEQGKKSKGDIWERLSLRESFQSKLSEAKPAVISYTAPEEKEESWLLNAALGYNFSRHWKSNLTFEVYAEYHRNTLVDKEQQNWQSGLALEWQIQKMITPKWSPILLSTVKYNEDLEKDVASLQGNLYLTPIFKSKGFDWRYFWVPHIKSDLGTLARFHYTPYIGFENENRIQATEMEDEGNIYRLLGRITAALEFFPLSEKWGNKIQLTADYHYRWNFSEDVESLTQEVQDFLTASVNYKFFSEDEGKREAMIGFDYVNGANPTKNFEDQSYYAVAFKLKL